MQLTPNLATCYYENMGGIGTQVQLAAGYDSATNEARRTALRFDTSAIDLSTITAAVFAGVFDGNHEGLADQGYRVRIGVGHATMPADYHAFATAANGLPSVTITQSGKVATDPFSADLLAGFSGAANSADLILYIDRDPVSDGGMLFSSPTLDLTAPAATHAAVTVATGVDGLEVFATLVSLANVPTRAPLISGTTAGGGSVVLNLPKLASLNDGTAQFTAALWEISVLDPAAPGHLLHHLVDAEAGDQTLTIETV